MTFEEWFSVQWTTPEKHMVMSHSPKECARAAWLASGKIHRDEAFKEAAEIAREMTLNRLKKKYGDDPSLGELLGMDGGKWWQNRK